jgi:hypothetical protein
LTTNNMTLKRRWKFGEADGFQKWRRFEGGPEEHFEWLVNESIDEAVAFAFTDAFTTEEKVEINTIA